MVCIPAPALSSPVPPWTQYRYNANSTTSSAPSQQQCSHKLKHDLHHVTLWTFSGPVTPHSSSTDGKNQCHPSHYLAFCRFTINDSDWPLFLSGNYYTPRIKIHFQWQVLGSSILRNISASFLPTATTEPSSRDRNLFQQQLRNAAWQVWHPEIRLCPQMFASDDLILIIKTTRHTLHPLASTT